MNNWADFFSCSHCIKLTLLEATVVGSVVYIVFVVVVTYHILFSCDQ